MKRKHLIFILSFIIIFYGLFTMLFILNETQLAVVLHFGNPVRVVREAGLYWKWPDPVETKIKFEKRVLVSDPVPHEYLTRDKKNIVVDFFLCWKIRDPLKFLQAVRDRREAELRLEDAINAEGGAVFGSYPLGAFLSHEDVEIRLDQITQLITQRCNQRAEIQYGIEVMDVQIKRLNFPEENKPSVFSRMRSERERIAKKYRSEGQEKASKIKAEAEKEKEIILSEAYKKAEIIKGEGDAKSMKIYADAYGRNPDFYRFMRTLQSYEIILDEKTTILLPSDMELLRLLKDKKGGISHEKRASSDFD